MDAVTYPDEAVVDFIQERMIPLRLQSDAKPYSADYNIQWTPTVITLDPSGKEHHRTTGFLAPEELVPSLLLGIAKMHFDAGQYGEAAENLEEVLSAYPESDSAPEALYLKGVCQYKQTHEAQPLKSAYEQLNEHYPSSEWTKRAYPYRLL
ncbi:MAG TPA: tetratricopeptide repeat protein [Thermodesulfobacteriota bacterium]|nr:tetratricopeptide repeat protein [Thermodesulfobacteriota bacterium]HQO78811.1 tetratricopeptide repeat protein [Thermodesulfobacteriota bacterium]